MKRGRYMKKIAVCLVAFGIACGSALAALDAYDSMTYTEISTIKDSAAGVTVTNATIDAAALRKGINALIVYMGSSSTNGTAEFGASATLQHNTVTNGNSFYTVTNGAGSAVVATSYGTNSVGTVTVFKIESEKLKRYVRLVTLSTNDSSRIGATLVSPK